MTNMKQRLRNLFRRNKMRARPTTVASDANKEQPEPPKQEPSKQKKTKQDASKQEPPIGRLPDRI